MRQCRALVLELKNVELSFNRGQVLHLLDLYVCVFLHFLVVVFELLLRVVRVVPSWPASKVWVLPTPLA